MLPPLIKDAHGSPSPANLSPHDHHLPHHLHSGLPHTLTSTPEESAPKPLNTPQNEQRTFGKAEDDPGTLSIVISVHDINAFRRSLCKSKKKKKRRKRRVCQRKSQFPLLLSMRREATWIGEIKGSMPMGSGRWSQKRILQCHVHSVSSGR